MAAGPQSVKKKREKKTNTSKIRSGVALAVEHNDLKWHSMVNGC